jgi:predicted ATPase/class 3 adenylate cyclase
LAAGEVGAELSIREDQIARLYVDGLSYKEIARDLEISPATVRTHLNTIYRKLEVSSRIELLHRLGRNGNVEIPPAPVPESAPAAGALAERRQLTVMFVDLVDSTAIAVGLDAEDMHELLQTYRAAVRREVEAFGGHVAGFPGDGVIACFGWPRALEDAAERSIRAGLAVIAAVGRLQAPGNTPLAARIGIATGMVVVDGQRGDADSLAGGTPNLAARLQGIAQPGHVVIAADTCELVGDTFDLEPLGEQPVKGLPKPVPVFRVRGEQLQLNRFEAQHARKLSPMVGRELELALLVERWERAKEGEGQAVLLIGEPGIGKSRIAAALIERAVADGARILRYQTSPQQGDSPLWPVRRQLVAEADLERLPDHTARLHRLGELLGDADRELGDALPLLAELLDIDGTAPPARTSAARRRELVIEILVRRLEQLARRSPVLMLFEDLHWIDPTSLELVERILGRIDEARVLLLLTSRPEDQPRLTGHPHLTAVTLNRLGKAAALKVVERLAGSDRLPDDMVATILARTDGVPLYIEEMTRATLERGGDVASVPASLQDSLMARLERLDAVKEVAQIAACIGREFDHDLLEAAAGEARAGLDEALYRLVGAELVFRRGDRFLFKHALVQDVAYQSLLRGPRALLHERIAEALLGRFPERAQAEPQTVAHHLEQAGRTEAAIDYYMRAADLANDKAANREARRYLERSLRLIETLPAGASRDRREVESLTMLGKVQAAIEGHASLSTKEVYSRALERCRAAGLRLAEFPIVLGLTIQAAVSGSADEALALARRLAELASGLDDSTLAVEADYALGITHSWRGELPLARHHLEAARRRYTIDQHPRHLALYGQDPGVVCGCRGALTLWYMGYADQARHLLDESLALAHRLGHSFSINYALNWNAMLALEAGEPEAAERAVALTLDHAGEQGFGTWLAFGAVCRARLVLDHGTPASAIEAIEKALAKVTESGSGVFKAYTLSLLGDALRRQGQHDAARDRLAEAVRLLEAGGARWMEAEVLRRRALCERDRGDTAAALATLEAALEVARRQEAQMLELRAAMDLTRLRAKLGEPERDATLLAACLAGFTEGFDTRDLREATTLLAELDA